MKTRLETLCKKNVADCTYEELYRALLALVKEESGKRQEETKGRKLYYISAEFLIGKLLSNNLINLGMYEEVDKILKENGKSMAELEEAEPWGSLFR